MGQDMKGRELGVGIAQRKDGRYTARFVDKRGKRKQKYFKKLQECRRWLAEAAYIDRNSDLSAGDSMTVDAWFDYFLNSVKGPTIRPNTRRNYTERYENNIKDHIGRMHLADVKPIHCQQILNEMAPQYAESTIYQCRVTLYTLFEAAVENDILLRNPVKKTVKIPQSKKPKKRRVLTVEEQKRFLDVAYGTSNYNQFAFLLQTGLRTGEMIGLKWSDIDFKKGVIRIERSMEYRHATGEWRIGPPKSKSGYREIPMTAECIRILECQKMKMFSLKDVDPQYKEFVFLCRKGEPTKNSAYDTSLFKLAQKAGMDSFSMHTLRHTYATRCIEAGMRPKTLQMLLGHSNIGITMNLYVHLTDDEKKKEVEKVERMLKMVYKMV